MSSFDTFSWELLQVVFYATIELMNRLLTEAPLID